MNQNGGHMFAKLKNSRGFTLIEVLLVIAIISILAGIVILAINPAKQLADSRNAQRRVDVNTIVNALYEYYADQKVPLSNAGIPTTPTDICATNAPSCSLINLSALTNGGKYLVAIPKDPLAANDPFDTHYQMNIDSSSGRVVITAPYAEQGVSISVTR